MPRVLASVSLAGLFQAICFGTSWAAPLESHIPAGQTGTLEIEVKVQGQLDRGKVDRDMKMVLRMKSEETAPLHLLSTRPDEDMQRQMDHMETVHGDYPQAEALMIDAGKAMEALIAACEANEQSAECEAAKARYEAANAKVDALSAEAEAKLAQAPEVTSQNRYQSWATDLDRGCGELVAQIRDGRKPAQQGKLKLPVSNKRDDQIPVCGTRLVLDRRAQQFSLAINPINVGVPQPGMPMHMGESLIDFTDLDESAGADVDAWAGVLFLREVPMQGSERQFSGSKTYRSERGVTTQVQWRFRQDG